MPIILTDAEHYTPRLRNPLHCMISSLQLLHLDSICSGIDSTSQTRWEDLGPPPGRVSAVEYLIFRTIHLPLCRSHASCIALVSYTRYGHGVGKPHVFMRPLATHCLPLGPELGTDTDKRFEMGQD